MFAEGGEFTAGRWRRKLSTWLTQIFTRDLKLWWSQIAATPRRQHEGGSRLAPDQTQAVPRLPLKSVGKSMDKHRLPCIAYADPLSLYSTGHFLVALGQIT